MYTSKHTSLSPNQFMRPQRDHSPSNKHQSKQNKYYSTQQVSRMIKAYIQPKLHYLKNQLDQKQKIIQILNQKLDQNDNKINKLYQYAQNLIKKQKQIQPNSQVIPIINQLLNDKIKQYWQTVNGQIQRVKQSFLQSNTIDSKKMQIKIQYQLQQIKKQTTQYIQSSRQRNNNYWLKIKQALNRINSKLMKVDQGIIKTNQNIQSFRQQYHHQHQYINQLQKSKSVAKKFIQLKKSVQNIYQNYQSLLQLQNNFKNQLNSKNYHKPTNIQDSNDLIDFNDSRQKQNQNDHFQQRGNTFPMFRKKNIDFKNNGIKNIDTQNQFLQPSQRDQFPQPTYQQENFALEYSRDQHNSQIYHAPLTSKSNAKDSENAFSTKYYVPTSVSSKKGNFNFLLGAQSPSKNTPQSSKWQHGLNSPNQLSCLNSSTNALRHGASRSTSFVNLSLENRNQMSQSVKQRLQEIIELKNLVKPLCVYLDEINYLKNNQGNYLFDTKGNMFKVNLEEGKQLQRLGIVKFIDKGNPKDNSSGKKNSLMFGNTTNHSQNIYSKGKNVGISSSKIKNISIKQTAI